MNKRTSKPKSIYSPSDPTSMNLYHLIYYTDTKDVTIVGNSSVKYISDNGLVKLNDGRQAKQMFSGTKPQCLERWKHEDRSHSFNKVVDHHESQNDDDDDDDDDDIDDILGSFPQSLQAPPATFSTPAPYRRRIVTNNRSISPDTCNTSTPSKRCAPDNVSDKSSKRCVVDNVSNENRMNPIADLSISSSDESGFPSSNLVSLDKIFRELRETKDVANKSLIESRNFHDELSKMTKKIAQFKSIINSKVENDLDRYRDTNDKENFQEEMMHQDQNLLTVSARNVGDYARSLLKILFTSNELQMSILPSRQSKRYAKPVLDNKRFTLLNEAVRIRYRISKRHYDAFYRDRLQSTLSTCIYNEGRRKLKHNSNTVDNQCQQHTEKIPDSASASITNN